MEWLQRWDSLENVWRRVKNNWCGGEWIQWICYCNLLMFTLHRACFDWQSLTSREDLRWSAFFNSPPQNSNLLRFLIRWRIDIKNKHSNHHFDITPFSKRPRLFPRRTTRQLFSDVLLATNTYKDVETATSRHHYLSVYIFTSSQIVMSAVLIIQPMIIKKIKKSWTASQFAKKNRILTLNSNFESSVSRQREYFPSTCEKIYFGRKVRFSFLFRMIIVTLNRFIYWYIHCSNVEYTNYFHRKYDPDWHSWHITRSSSFSVIVISL